MLISVTERYWHICKVRFLSTSTRYPHPNPIGPLCMRYSLFWLTVCLHKRDHTVPLPDAINYCHMAFEELDSKFTTCNQLLYFVRSWTIAARLPLAALILLLVSSFRLVIWSFITPACNQRQCKTVVIKVTRSDKITENLVISKNLVSLLHLCAPSDISACPTRTVEMDTTWVSIGCHSVRTVLEVKRHHLRTITLM